VTFVLHVDERGVPTTRIADFSFIRRGRIPKDIDWSKPFMGAPDLAVEVISPAEKADETLAKVNDYLRFGTEQVWVAYPSLRQVYVYRKDQPEVARIYQATDVLEAPSLFPGLKINVADLFVIEDED
jgi:Uma2 family endonuclease